MSRRKWLTLLASSTVKVSAEELQVGLSAASLAVCLRLLRALNDIDVSTSEPQLRVLAVARGKRILDGCALDRMENQRHILQERLASLEKLVTGNGQATAR